MALEPKEPGKSRNWSLSGTYGLGAFPWHTDGAIASTPPRWMLLKAMHISYPTFTDLLVPDPEMIIALRGTILRAKDKFGRVRYLPAAVHESGLGHRVRWDPRTCTPRTGIAIEDVERRSPTERIAWNIGRMLVVDNFQILHRRPAVEKGKRMLERTYVWDA
jgi:Taurine catabolism dioxygenase TauD, TfdA family